MNDATAYIESIVEPTYKDLQAATSPRQAFLTAVALYHCIDRAAPAMGLKQWELRQKWCATSMSFQLIDLICHKFKHVKSSTENDRPDQWGGYMTLGDVIRRMTAIEFLHTAGDAIRFVKAEVSNI